MPTSPASTPSDPELLVLQAIRVRAVAATGDVATAAGLTVDEARQRLASLAAAGLVAPHAGALPGWSLTAQGRRRDDDLLASELEAAGCRAEVERAYGRFRPLNAELLAVCTAWQVRPPDAAAAGAAMGSTHTPRVNDHADRSYDDAVVARLVALHDAAVPVLRELAVALDRFAGYEPRLGNALDRTRAGSRDWFTKPTIDSYHTVWFELHEDLLSTLGLDRAGEASTADDEAPVPNEE